MIKIINDFLKSLFNEAEETEQPEEEVYCINCKHCMQTYRTRYGSLVEDEPKCTHPKDSKIYPCGTEGMLFEPKYE